MNLASWTVILGTVNALVGLTVGLATRSLVVLAAAFAMAIATLVLIHLLQTRDGRS